MSEIAVPTLDYLNDFTKPLIHELKTLLAAINCGLSGSSESILALTTAAKCLGSTELSNQQIKILSQGLTLAERAAYNASRQLSNFAINLTNISLYSLNSLCSMKDCLEEAIRNFPYKSDCQRALLPSVIKAQYDFSFIGDKTLMVNLLINSFNYILNRTQTKKAEIIHIWTKKNSETYKLCISDSSFISEEELSNLFRLDYAVNKPQIGLGFVFNKKLMQALNGDIVCSRTIDNFLKITCSFPIINSVEGQQ